MYTVVFEGVGVELGGNYKGIRTRVDYESREEFLQTQAESQNPDTVLAEGISSEAAQDLVEATPLVLYFHAAVDEAFEGGHLDPDILFLKIANAIFLGRLRDEL